MSAVESYQVATATGNRSSYHWRILEDGVLRCGPNLGYSRLSQGEAQQSHHRLEGLTLGELFSPS